MGRERIELQESATTRMPTTAECILRAAAALKPILPEDFFGRIVISFEHGMPARLVKEESYKL